MKRVVSKLLQLVRPAPPLDLEAWPVASDPYPHYEALRANGSVHFLPHHKAWIVLGYDDVQSAFARPQIFSNAPYAPVDEVLLAADPPAHPPVRRIVARYFGAETLDRLQAFAEQRSAELLSAPTIEIVSEYAVVLSESVAAELIGFDDAAVAAIREARANAPELSAYGAAIDGVARSASMYERLVADGLDDAQARSLVRLLWLAAVTTTERAIAWTVWRLLEHRDIRAAVLDDPALVPAFVDEVLRLHPPELMVPRMTTEAVEIGGRKITANSLVYLSIAAANRDPSKFDEPAEFRLDRGNARHFSFGSGVHYCVGATLGRRTIETAVRTLLTTAPNVTEMHSIGDVVRWCSMTASPVGMLHVELHR